MTTEDSRTADATDPQPTFTATPRNPSVTSLLELELTGLSPGQEVTIEATFDDLGTHWQSHATFMADNTGRISPTEDAAIDGAYTGVRPMGLVQFASQVGNAPIDTRAEPDYTTLELTATSETTRIAATTIKRSVGTAVNKQPLSTAEVGVAGHLYTPPDSQPAPAIVALHGSGGTPYGRKARLLASHGFVVLALQYFGDPAGIPSHFGEIPVEYVDTAIDYLQEHDRVSGGEIGLIAASRGTELAFLTAAHRDDVGAVAAYTPSAYAWPGRPENESEKPPSAWTVDGDPHPIVPRPGPKGASPEQTDCGLRLRPMFEACVAQATETQLADATLPFESITADVMLISGTDDGVWQASEMAETIVQNLQQTPNSVTHHCYEDAGHSIFLPYHPTARRSVSPVEDGPDIVHGGTPEGNANADCDSWSIVTRFFERLQNPASASR